MNEWVRRLPIALLLVSVLAAAGTLATTGTEGKAYGFVLPPPRIGDNATYAVHRVEGGNASSFTQTAYWMDAGTLLMADGSLVPTDRFGHSSSYLHGSSLAIDFRRGSTDIVAISMSGSLDESSIDDDMMGLPIATSNEVRGAYGFRFLLPAIDYAACGSGEDLRGRVLRSDQGFRLDCLSVLMSLGPGEYRPLGVVTWEERPALAFESRFHAGEHSSVTRVTFVPSYAYPVLVETTETGADSRSATFVLTGFTPGSVLRDAVDGPSPLRPMPPLEWSQPGPRILVVEDVDSRFSIAEALSVAASEDAEVADFLRTHPAAVVWSAHATRTAMAGLVEHSWRLEIADEEAGLYLRVQRTLAKQAWDLPEPLRSSLAGDEVLTMAGEPKAEVAPNTVPTASSLQAAGKWYWDGDADCYGYGPGWMGGVNWSAGHCSQTVDAGLAMDPPGARVTGTLDSRTIHLNATGLLAISELAWAGQTTASPPTGGQDPGPGAPPLSRVRGEALGTLPITAGVGLASLFVGAAYVLWPTLKGAAVGLFTRVQPDGVLAHTGRRRILDEVRAKPGIHLRALSRATGIEGGSLVHHLRTLERAGHIRVEQSNGYRLHFPGKAETGVPMPAAAGALAAQGARAILAELQATPGVTGQVLATRTGLAPSTVSYHLRRLEGAGVVRHRRAGRFLHWEPLDPRASWTRSTTPHA